MTINHMGDTTMRIGHKMRLAAAFVRSNPGCVTRRVAHYVSPHPTPSRNESLGYNIVDRAWKAGLIVIKPDPTHKGRSLCFPVD